MDQEALVSESKHQLSLVLSFFQRVDARASVLLAIDTGMLGYLASHIPQPSSLALWESFAPCVAAALLGGSLYYLYKCSFPNLKGGDRSLIYFQEVAKRTESKFIEEFTTQKESDYTKDILGQAWRNSEVLSQKFAHLKLAFVLMAVSVVPWILSLAEFSMRGWVKNPGV